MARTLLFIIAAFCALCYTAGDQTADEVTKAEQGGQPEVFQKSTVGDEDAVAKLWLEEWHASPWHLEQAVWYDEGQEWSPLSRAVRAASGSGGQGSIPGASGNKIPVEVVREVSLGVVRALVRMGAEVDGTLNKYKKTPLIEAAERGDAEVVKVLLELGANVKATDIFHRTALHMAAHFGHAEVARLLLKNKADKYTQMGAQDHNMIHGGTPLHQAAANAHPEVVKAILESRINPDTRCVDGRTALYYAAASGDEESVKLLLDARASPDLMSEPRGGEETVAPIHVAALAGHTEVCQLLVKGGADINIQDHLQRTPLHLAAAEGHAGTVKALLELGADWKAKDKTGRYPEDMSASKTIMAVFDSGKI